MLFRPPSAEIFGVGAGVYVGLATSLASAYGAVVASSACCRWCTRPRLIPAHCIPAANLNGLRLRMSRLLTPG